MSDLAARLAYVEQRLRGIPSRFAGGGSAPPAAVEVWLQVERGNTLTGGLYGIKSIGTQLAAQATWRDPYSTGTFPDGLGRAKIWRNGVQGLVRDADAWKPSTAYAVGNKVRGSTSSEAFVCTVAGTSATAAPGPTGSGTGIVDGSATWDADPSVGWKAEQVLALLDTRAQFRWAVGETEWARVFAAVVIGNAVNPSTGLAEDMTAFPLAYT